MHSIEQRELQRLRYRQGQMLRSQDLNDQAVIEGQLRWWHNRGAHNAYGVVAGILEGFAVELSDPSAKEFTVKPGVAYDCFGRELVLARELKTKTPDEITEGSATLLVQYQPPAAHAEPISARQPSKNASAGPALVWKAGRVSVRDGVPIARISDITKLDGGAGISVDRPIARPLARPHIANGRTHADGSGWELWTQKTSGGEFFLGFQIIVDTSAAGFTKVPCYFAWMPTLLTDLVEISGSDVHGFTFRLWFPTFIGLRLDNNPFLVFFLTSVLKTIAAQVCWIGIESRIQESLGVI
jgi:hypothetical protein